MKTGNKGRILVVDDERSMREMLEIFLGREGYSVVGHSSANEAVSSLEEDREYDLHHIRRGVEEGESWDIEHRLLMEDGRVKWVHAVGEVERDDAGGGKMVMGTLQDISQQKQHEEKIRNSLKEKEILLMEEGSRAQLEPVAGLMGYQDVGVVRAYDHLLIHYHEQVQSVRSTVGVLVDERPRFLHGPRGLERRQEQGDARAHEEHDPDHRSHREQRGPVRQRRGRAPGEERDQEHRHDERGAGGEGGVVR